MFFISRSVSFSSSAMDKYVENALIDVCKASTTNSVNKFNQIAKSYRLKSKTVAMKVMCNGDDISDFARKHGSYKVAAKLERSMKSQVSITDVAALDKINVNFIE